MFRVFIVLVLVCYLKKCSATDNCLVESDDDDDKSAISIPIYEPDNQRLDGSGEYTESDAVQKFRYRLLGPSRFSVVYFGEKGAGKSRLIEIALGLPIGTLCCARFTSNGEGHTKMTKEYPIRTKDSNTLVHHHDTVGFCDSTPAGRINIVRAALEFRTQLYEHGDPLRRIYFVVNASSKSCEHLENNLRFIRLAYGLEAVSKLTFIINQCDTQKTSPKSFFDDIVTKLQEKFQKVSETTSNCRILFTSCVDGKPLQFFEDLILAAHETGRIHLGHADAISEYEHLQEKIDICTARINDKVQQKAGIPQIDYRAAASLESGIIICNRDLTNLCTVERLNLTEYISTCKDEHQKLSFQICLDGQYPTEADIWRICGLGKKGQFLEALIYDATSVRKACPDRKLKFMSGDEAIKLFEEFEQYSDYRQYFRLDLISVMADIVKKKLTKDEDLKQFPKISTVNNALATRDAIMDKLDRFKRNLQMNPTSLNGLGASLNRLDELSSSVLEDVQNMFQYIKGKRDAVQDKLDSIANSENELVTLEGRIAELQNDLESKIEEYLSISIRNSMIELVNHELDDEIANLRQQRTDLTLKYDAFEAMLGYVSRYNDSAQTSPSDSTFEIGETSSSG